MNKKSGCVFLILISILSVIAFPNLTAVANNISDSPSVSYADTRDALLDRGIYRVVSNDAGLTFRKEPSTKADKIHTLYNDDIVLVLGEQIVDANSNPNYTFVNVMVKGEDNSYIIGWVVNSLKKAEDIETLSEIKLNICDIYTLKTNSQILTLPTAYSEPLNTLTEGEVLWLLGDYKYDSINDMFFTNVKSKTLGIEGWIQIPTKTSVENETTSPPSDKNNSITTPNLENKNDIITSPTFESIYIDFDTSLHSEADETSTIIYDTLKYKNVILLGEHKFNKKSGLMFEKVKVQDTEYEGYAVLTDKILLIDNAITNYVESTTNNTSNSNIYSILLIVTFVFALGFSIINVILEFRKPYKNPKTEKPPKSPRAYKE